MKIRKRKKLPKWYFTISLSGPILWVVFAKVLEVSYDKLFICSLLSMPCSFIISLIWLIDFYDKVLLEYDKLLGENKSNMIMKRTQYSLFPRYYAKANHNNSWKNFELNRINHSFRIK